MGPSFEREVGSATVVVTRGDGVEAWHRVAVAVVDGQGRLTHKLGDPTLVTFARSAIKPFQALPLVMTGALDEAGFGNAELALAASSHDGTDHHRRLAERMLATTGLSAAALQCGTHLPFFMRAPGQYPVHGEDRDPLRHNCSGKHAGFLAVAHKLRTSPAAYLAPEGAVQQLVRRAVAEVCEVDEASMPSGTDGCSAPNFALPLDALARGFVKLATRTAAPKPAGAAAPPSLDEALQRVRQAMQAHPELVSGEGRFDYLLQAQFGSRIVTKGGAEALQAIGFAEPALGIVVKVVDGGERALAPACLSVLGDLGLLPATLSPPLEARARPVLLNQRGLETGTVRVLGRLERVA